ncbi:MAG: GDP-mannose 4,6-dehydratase [Candidatus Liptonbacteria bacterium RIFOXYC1_FULL_36_8]|uniref:GDP-mannose 4,6-dehydratase n=3 Tax=Candidatus Liptoniibacteriota TaxID=1817909 RepID=A0A1G2CMK0_9BACT|nr:MAG: GDP-mannose 4,6-dehydratase [Candidatus Liptonbacteria bacterium RIFOXYB1_FULL_36_10]OGZ03511.1 MAG: GDP-mannose 4,6-dehydratase [Candidatus Liptonbacteria bacterium RIFOXYC1_FULL_36_8]OGZ03635.1 MAG: GDP-mannose 4,6-dehydratase [Candidatus Liptonbacteria bacterium RIFOXYD1_FULL_36_11]
MKKALITGITGQDGSYLAEILLQKGYEVHGLIRRVSTFNRQNIEHIFNTDEKREKYLHYGDLTDINSLISVLEKIKPDEIYNLAAQSHVRVSFDIPLYTAQVDALGVLSLLEAIRILGLKAKFYQASTSELFSGDKGEASQNEKTSFKPKSPYGAAKLYAFEIARIYRESYGIFTCNGILFNHESPRRGTNFVTKKVTRGVAEIKKGLRDVICLGNLDARRDWGFAPEYMEAAWRMLQQDKPDDYIIATGETHSIRELVEEAFGVVNIELEWKGFGLDEQGFDKKTGKVLIKIDREYFRPNEVSYLCGDYKKAGVELGWKPKTTFKDLVQLMVKADLEKVNGVSFL